MNRFLYSLANFFRGRYGIDNIFYAFCVVAVILSAVNLFVHSRIIQLIVYLMFVLAAVRAMSRNLTKRSEESRKFGNFLAKIQGKPYAKTVTSSKKGNGFFSKIKNKISLLKRMFKDRKTHCYVKCPGCKKVLRLPKKKGVHTVKCPNCSESFKVKI